MKSRPIILYLLVYVLFLAAMHFGHGFGVAEPLLVLLVFGLGLSLLALWSTRHAKLRNSTVKHPSILIAIGVLRRGHLASRVFLGGPLDSYSEPPVARAGSHRWRPAAPPCGNHSPVALSGRGDG